MVERANQVEQTLGTVMSLFDKESFHPSRPLRVIPISDICEALSALTTGEVSGSVVVEADSAAIVPAIITSSAPYSFHANAIYVIAGGFGGIGRCIARWMAERGARNLLLLSRSGPRSSAAHKLMDDLRAMHVHLQAAICDIADIDALRRVLAECTGNMPPIRGCVQAMMTLQSCTPPSQNPQRQNNNPDYNKLITPKMSFWQELASWNIPTTGKIAEPPKVGTQAPNHPALTLPTEDKKPAIVIFLRHCGCPFAEKAYRTLNDHPAIQNNSVVGIAVSHSSKKATEAWQEALITDQNHPLRPSEQNPIRLVVDEEREVYAAWGLGVSSTWHVLSPSTIASVVSLGWSEGIWNRPTESGSRWQTAGDFAVDGQGVVRWAHVYQGAGDVGDIDEAVKAVLKVEGESE